LRQERQTLIRGQCLWYAKSMSDMF
jgi:hypothetical protein